MKLIIDTQGVPERTIDLDASDSDLQLIKSQLVHLNVYKNDGRKPSQDLLDDIYAYERLIAGGQELCRAYMD